MTEPPEETTPTFGLIPDPAGQPDSMRMLAIKPLATAPETRYTKFAPRPRNQNPYGTCVAFAAWNQMTGRMSMIREWDIHPSWFSNLSPAYIYEGCKELDGYAGEGTWGRFAGQWLEMNGCIHEVDFPYGSVRPGSGMPPGTEKHVNYHYRIRENVKGYTLDHVRELLSNLGPIMVGVAIQEDFIHAKSWPLRYDPNQRIIGYHEMAAYGHQDSSGEVILQNSWGDWGEVIDGKRGMCRLTYDYMDHHLLEVHGFVLDHDAFELGDITGDDRVDILDVQMMLAHAVGTGKVHPTAERLADYTGDRIIDIRDVTLGLKKAIGGE